MSSGKLDRSLDEIMKDGKAARRGGRNPRNSTRRAAVNAKAKIAAPAGGVTKNSRQPKANRPTAPVVSAPTTGESKIIVSGLPEDVEEDQVKDYFSKSIGPVKRAMLTFGPNGRSRGVATVIFNKPGSAAEAAKTLNGMKVDQRTLKIEVVIGAKSVVTVPVKTLSDRISGQPKSAAKNKPKTKEGGPKAAAAPKGAKPVRGGKKSGHASRPKPKTTEELDAEMQDYFGGDNTATNGAAVPAANDTNMDGIS